MALASSVVVQIDQRSLLIAAAAVVSLATLTACSGDDAVTASNTTDGTNTSTTITLPDVVLSDLDGQSVSLRSLIGTPLVVNYWYSTCPPCKAEMPALGAVAAEFSGSVRFVGINTQDTATVARQVAAERGATFEHLLDRTGRSVDAFALTGFPTTLFIDAAGNVIRKERRALTADDVRRIIREDLAP